MAQSRNDWKRPLIVGASGQVGTELFEALTRASSADVVRTSRTLQPDWLTLDLARTLTVEDVVRAFGEVNPDLILCTGAMTHVDGCEDQPELASRTNTYGPAALAAYARGRNIPFVYFSSDYVFDGTMERPGPYAETAEPHPLSVYGRTKFEGERAVLRVHPEALVVRTSWVYGPDAARKNFVSFLLRQLRAGERVRVPADQVSTPTFNRDLARVTLDLVASGCQGVVHVTGPELMSRLQLAEAVAQFFGLEQSLLEGVPTSSLGQRAKRPLLSGLISRRVEQVDHGAGMRSFHRGLQEMADALGDVRV